jgi:hypothetical protein
MAVYILPQVRVFQEFTLNVDADIRPLLSFITGGHAYLLRCSEADEKAVAGIGNYDHVGASVDGVFKTCYSWPGKPTGSVIDETYTKLCIDKAMLRFWTDTSDLMTKTASNKIRQPTKAFADNAADPTTYPKHADFLDRGVVVGDIVRVTGSSDAGATMFDLCTYVTDIEGDTVVTAPGTATASANNPATQIAGDTDTAHADNSGDIVILSVDNSGYDGRPSGFINETYTVTCIQASTGSDHTTALLQVTSASGLDDVASVAPSAETVATAIGARGLTVTFDDGTGTDFIVGESWVVTVAQAYTAPTGTEGGPYTGTIDRDYIIEFTIGGDGVASFSVTTQQGTDFSGPTIVAAPATDYAVGSYGVTIQFDVDEIAKGERFTIAAWADKEGLMKTLVLAHNLDPLIPLDDATNAVLDVALYMQRDIEVGEKHVRVGGQYNWDQSDTEFCARAGIEAFEATWTDSGTPVALVVVDDPVCTDTNEMYLEYRAWRSDLAVTVNTLNTIGDIDTAISGPLTPDNTLKWNVYYASLNSGDQPIKYMAVADPALTASWTAVLDTIEDRDDVYGLVPLTYDATITNLFQAHVNEQSGPSNNRFRVMWTGIQNVKTISKVDEDNSSDTAVVLATTEDDPDTSGTQYTKLVITSANVNLVARGIRAGDTVRYQYTTDAWGDVSYSEYVIDSVVNEVTVLLEAGTAIAENVAIKVEIWRSLTKEEQSVAIGQSCGNWADRRVRAIAWPETPEEAGTSMTNLTVAAAYAGLSSGVQPHQGLTNVELKGFDGVQKDYFSRSQLDTIAVNGGFIVDQDLESGEVFARHAVTTDDYENINVREEMITRNVDSISFKFFDQYSPYIGKANATPGIIEVLESETLACIQFLRSANQTQLLGGQLIDATIDIIRISAEFKDRVVIQMTLNVPVALNNIDVHLIV